MRSIDAALEHIEQWAIFLVLVVLFAVTILQVVTRYGFGHVLFWCEEAATFLFVWLIFLAASPVLRKGQHIAVSLFIEMFPPRLRVVLRAIGELSMLGILMTLVWFGLILSYKSFDIPSAAMEIPLTWLFAAVPVSCAFMLISTMIRLGTYTATMFTRQSAGKNQG